MAGLTCAKVLVEAGREVVLLEAAGGPGGRVVSQATPEGYVLDRGFQVLLDSYPAARRHLDFQRLGGGCFRSGALFVGRGRPGSLENPLRKPPALARVLRGDIIPHRDLLRLAGLVVRAMGSRGAEVTTRDMLRSAGFSREFMSRFAEPFFGGVLLDPELGTSARLLLGYLRRFATGRAWLPGGGIGDVAKQLAAAVPVASLRFGCRVTGLRLENGAVCGVGLEGGSVLESASVVLATDEPSTCGILGRGKPRAALATAVHYFSASERWYEGAWLCLPPRERSSPVLHAALLTNIAPTLAPKGRHLWSVTVLPDHRDAEKSDVVASAVAAWFGRDAAGLRHVEFIRVPYAVPAQPPGFHGSRSPWGDLPRGVLVAGDAATGASIDAVMQSGEEAAKKVVSLAGGN